MQELNHDMEDLFRRAAENYPLKQRRDWDTITQKLDATLPQIARQNGNKKRWLFLLLFLFIATGFYLAIEGIPGYRDRPSSGKTGVASTQAEVDPGKPTPNIENSTVDKKPGDIAPVALERFSDANGQLLIESSNKPASTGRSTSNYDFSTRQSNAQQKQVIEKGNQEVVFLFNEPRSKNQSAQPAKATSSSIINEPTSVTLLGLFDNPYAYKKLTVSPVEMRIDSMDQPLVTNVPQPQKQTVLKSKPTFYFGLTGGLALNSVKFNRYNKAFEGGIVTGIQFNNRFSAEAALLYTMNNYEAKSMHFDKKNIAGMLTGGRQLDEVHGSNKLIDIPLSVRYKFSPGTKSVYASAGLSSYIMTRETNWYLTTLNGANEMLYGDYDKKNVYFASALNLSAGYQLPVGRKNTLRLEPYVQLPLRGIGVGNIRLMSVGLHVGFISTTR